MRRLGFVFLFGFALTCVFALGGCWPPPAQILQQPAHVDPNVVTLAADLDSKLVRAQKPGELLARLRIDARPLQRSFHPAINLALVIDTSGSMEGDAIRDAKAAAGALVNALSDGDRLAIVTFNSRTQVLVPSQPVSAGAKPAILKRIESIRARSTTDLFGGLQAGYREVSQHFNKSGINRVVLISDGVPNAVAPILPLATTMGQAGIAVTSLGLGLDFDETLMGQIAQRSGGRYHLVEKSTEVAKVFRDEVLRLRRVVGRNLQLSLAAGPGVQIKEIVGHGAVAGVPLGELGEDESRDVIVRLSVPAHRDGATIELFDALLAFDDALDNAGHFQRQLFLAAHATTDEAALKAAHNPEVVEAAEKARAAAQIVAAIAEARSGNLPGAQAQLDAVSPVDDEMRESVAQLRASLAQGMPVEVLRIHDLAMRNLQPR